MGCIILLNLFSLISTFCFQIPHGCCDISESLFEATPTGIVFEGYGVVKVTPIRKRDLFDSRKALDSQYFGCTLYII